MKRRAAALLLLLLAACRGETPEALYARGRTAFERGDYDVAERIAREGEARYARDAPWHETFSILEAECLGRNDPTRAMAILDRTPSAGVDRVTVRRLMARGYALNSRGKNGEADALYGQADALAARAAPALRPEIAMRRSGTAASLDEAERWARQAIAGATAAKQTWVLANAYGLLAFIEMRREHWRQSADYRRIAFGYAHAVQAKATEASLHINAGYASMSLGDYDEAMSEFRSALPYVERQALYKQQHVALTQIADIYVRRLELSDALPFAQRALAAARRLGDPRSIANSLGQLATIDLELGRFAEARALNDQAARIRAASVRHDVVYSRLLEARIDAATGDVPHAIEILESIVASENVDASMRLSAQGIIADVDAKLGKLADAQAMYEATLKSADEARKSVQGSNAFAFDRLVAGVYDNYIDLLLGQKRAADALRVAERSRARTLREAIGLDPHTNVDPPAVARAKHATILCYWLGAKRSLLWTVTPAGVESATLPAAAAIDRDVDAYADELQSSRHSLDSRLGAALFDMLAAPARVAPGSRVIVLPAGHLNALSFETLIAPSPQRHYWIEDVTLSYSPSLQLLASAPSWRAPREPRLLALGNVPAQGREFPELARAGEELRDVAGYFDPSHRVVLDHTNATPRAYTAAQPRQFDFIHFAAHATASTRVPLDSAVILASGRLSGADIVNVPLAAQLVTVSSCSSAGRRSYAGEGLVGLSWAFLRAGAQRVVAAQWEVVDSATPRIMNAMYGGIARGLDPAEALRQAKLSLLRSNQVYRDPSYWAPFALYGAV